MSSPARAQLGGGSERQLEDVAALLALGGTDLDLDHIRRWVQALRLEGTWSRVKRP